MGAPDSKLSNSCTSSDQLGSWIDSCLDLPAAERELALQRMFEEHPAEREALQRRVQLLRDAGLLEITEEHQRLPDCLGPYRLEARLGGGGMGVVYAALDASLDRRVALKILRPELQIEEAARRRFLREIDAVARLQHENIVPIYAAGEEAGVAFLAMQLVEGLSLAELLVHLPLMDPERIERATVEAIVAARLNANVAVDLSRLGSNWLQMSLEIGRQVAEALEHAHGRGVVHRDVKPSNLMLTPRGTAMLLDFGLAQAGGSTRLTHTGSVMGSLAYMSPEQVRGETHAIDARSDVYALGATLCELICREPPFPQRELISLRVAILTGHPTSPRRRMPSLSRDVDAVILTALARDPARRYASAGELVRDLTRLLEGSPVEARSPSHAERFTRWCRRHPTLATVALLLVVGPSAFAVQEFRARLAIERELSRSAAHLRLIRGNVSEMLRETYRDVAGLPGARVLRARLLERARRTLVALEQQVSAETPLHAELAGLHGLLGELAFEEGTASAADTALPREHYARALEHWRQELDRSPGVTNIEINVHSLERRLSRLCLHDGDAAGARVWMERALQGFEALLLREPLHRDLRRELIAALGNAADIPGLAAAERGDVRARLETLCAELLRTDKDDVHALHGRVTNALRMVPELTAAEALPMLEGVECDAERLVELLPEHVMHARLFQRVRLERAKLLAAPPRSFESLALLVSIEEALARRGELGADLEGSVLAFEVAFVAVDVEALALALPLVELGDRWERCFARLLALPKGSGVQRHFAREVLSRWGAWLFALEDQHAVFVAEHLERFAVLWIEARAEFHEDSELEDWREFGRAVLRETVLALGRCVVRMDEAVAAGRADLSARAARSAEALRFSGLLLQRAMVLHDLACRLLPDETALARFILDPAVEAVERAERIGVRGETRYYVEFSVCLLRGSIAEAQVARLDTARALTAADAWCERRTKSVATEISHRAMRWRALVQGMRLCGPLHGLSLALFAGSQAQVLQPVASRAVAEGSLEARSRFISMALSASPVLADLRQQALELAPTLLEERAPLACEQYELSTLAQIAFELGQLARAVDLAERARLAHERGPVERRSALDGLERRRELARYRAALAVRGGAL